MEQNRKFIPAFSYSWLTSYSDFLWKTTMREMVYKKSLLEQAGIENSQRILDLGCGTATLTIMAKNRHPEADIVGLDADPKILKIALDKIARMDLKIDLDQGMGFSLPYEDNSFNRVVSTLFFHHLTRKDKNSTLAEVFRVLRTGGELHIADFGKPGNLPMIMIGLIIKNFEETRDNIDGLLPEMMRHAGFNQVSETKRIMTVWGSVSLYRAIKP
jgi:ubiquinone/menaquinone biosynthesis C-methylase UbiE